MEIYLKYFRMSYLSIDRWSYHGRHVHSNQRPFVFPEINKSKPRIFFKLCHDFYNFWNNVGAMKSWMTLVIIPSSMIVFFLAQIFMALIIRLVPSAWLNRATNHYQIWSMKICTGYYFANFIWDVLIFRTVVLHK